MGTAFWDDSVTPSQIEELRDAPSSAYIEREALILKAQAASGIRSLFEAARNTRLFYFPPGTKNKLLRP